MKIRQDRTKYNIGTNIRKFRKQCNMTQNEIITQMQLLGVDISRSTYSHLECGIDNIKVSQLLALSIIFDVEIGSFFDGMTL